MYDAEITPLDQARIRLSDAMRDVMHAVVGHDTEIERLHELAAALEAAAPVIKAGPKRARELGGWEDRTTRPRPVDGQVLVSHPIRPIYGAANPCGIPYIPRVEQRDVVTEVVLGSAFEGAPGRSHGGVVAAMFDDLMGFVMEVEGTVGFTGWLKITYRGGVPIGESVEFRARLDSKNGRKLSIVGEARHGDDVVIEAEALFIEVDPEWFAAQFPTATGSPGPAN